MSSNIPFIVWQVEVPGVQTVTLIHGSLKYPELIVGSHSDPFTVRETTLFVPLPMVVVVDDDVVVTVEVVEVVVDTVDVDVVDDVVLVVVLVVVVDVVLAVIIRFDTVTVPLLIVSVPVSVEYKLSDT